MKNVTLRQGQGHINLPLQPDCVNPFEILNADYFFYPKSKFEIAKVYEFGLKIRVCGPDSLPLKTQEKTSASSNGKSFKYQRFTSSGFKDRKVRFRKLV